MTRPNYDEMRDFRRNAHGAKGPRYFTGPGSIRRLIAETVAGLAIGAFCVFAIPYVFDLIIWAFN